jgi:hypothetical protein
MAQFWMRRGFVLLACLFFLASCAMMQADKTVRLTGKLSGSSEVPPVASDGAGTVVATLDKETNLLRWTVIYSGLSGPARAGHFHGPAMASENAGVVLPFKTVESPIQDQATLTPAQAADVLAGKWYVNLHTARNPGGEIRAQVVPAN